MYGQVPEDRLQLQLRQDRNLPAIVFAIAEFHRPFLRRQPYCQPIVEILEFICNKTLTD